MIFTHNFSPHGATLWNNRVVVINRKSLFKKDWYERDICFVTDIMDEDGEFLEYNVFIDKFQLICTPHQYNKICKAVPLPLTRLIQNIIRTSNVRSLLPRLILAETPINNKECNNRCISTAFKTEFFHNFNRALFITSDEVTVLVMEKAHTRYVKWPVSPKVKETHFKIVNKIYPVAEFLKRRFRFEVEPCVFCNGSDETIEHMFYLCPVSQSFWLDVHDWLSLKIDDLQPFFIPHILFYMDNINSSISDLVNIVILMGKYHIHCCKWRSVKPSFLCFINEFKLYCLSLRKLKSKVAGKILKDIFSMLLL